jgi:hypothetical protein
MTIEDPREAALKIRYAHLTDQQLAEMAREIIEYRCERPPADGLDLYTYEQVYAEARRRQRRHAGVPS